MKKSMYVTFAVSLLFSTMTFANEECSSFKVVNNLEQNVYLSHDKTSEDICSIPQVIKVGETGEFSMRKESGSHKPEVYISFRTPNMQKKYNLFAKFAVTAENQRIIREESISKDAAYSWNRDNSIIYLCSAERYTEKHTCR